MGVIESKPRAAARKILSVADFFHRTTHPARIPCRKLPWLSRDGCRFPCPNSGHGFRLLDAPSTSEHTIPSGVRASSYHEVATTRRRPMSEAPLRSFDEFALLNHPLAPGRLLQSCCNYCPCRRHASPTRARPCHEQQTSRHMPFKRHINANSAPFHGQMLSP